MASAEFILVESATEGVQYVNVAFIQAIRLRKDNSGGVAIWLEGGVIFVEESMEEVMNLIKNRHAL